MTDRYLANDIDGGPRMRSEMFFGYGYKVLLVIRIYYSKAVYKSGQITSPVTRGVRATRENAEKEYDGKHFYVFQVTPPLLFCLKPIVMGQHYQSSGGRGLPAIILALFQDTPPPRRAPPWA